ncbi:helix-turn-helix domain-containing protein [Comamonas aquatica]|uniref:helix-turn-helix domain-containing protein n=1 Tax=Comamonas aquatica TaxID=225991 RepID=UPI002447F74B|nr:helix-turn-helix domain-containing protein [Comamonas aquatica]MDH0380416.1 helix-turn-helix domain-containing protein [Comamonas aquatica]MDH0428436.1 helix-turn-helix domain-containing protein [Comamonas aquatica]MDH0939561.1 helix-turn-helix domain-containing protein [Comamonas aquatica]
MQVQKLRLQRGWSQQQLAELSGLSVRTIQRIENGSAASTESLKSLASVFEIDFSTLSSEPAMPDTPTPTSPSTHTPSASQQEQLALLEVRKLKGFYLHLAQYVVVIAALCAINLLTTPHRLWFYWAALGWGIGILAHAAAIFSWLPFLGVDWEKRQVEKRLGRPL